MKTQIDKALAFLAENREEDGRWDIRKSGGQAGHDVSSTAFSLLAFYGRGERHDEKCSYQSVVRKGIDWLVNEQDIATGDGKRPAVMECTVTVSEHWLWLKPMG